jgi:hypothetical protein
VATLIPHDAVLATIPYTGRKFIPHGFKPALSLITYSKQYNLNLRIAGSELRYIFMKPKYDSRIKGNILQESVMFMLLRRKSVKINTFASCAKCHCKRGFFHGISHPQTILGVFVKLN